MCRPRYHYTIYACHTEQTVVEVQAPPTEEAVEVPETNDEIDAEQPTEQPSSPVIENETGQGLISFFQV